MQKRDNDEQIRAPVMDVGNQLPEQDLILAMKDTLIGSVRKRLVNKLQEKTRANQKHHQDKGHSAQTPGECEMKRSLGDSPGPEMEDEGIEKAAISLPFLSCARKNRIPDPLKQTGMLNRG